MFSRMDGKDSSPGLDQILFLFLTVVDISKCSCGSALFILLFKCLGAVRFVLCFCKKSLMLTNAAFI